jgi:hypothetical protein
MKKQSIKFTYTKWRLRWRDSWRLDKNVQAACGCLKTLNWLFTKGDSTGIRGSVVVDKSGSGSMVITTTIKSINFGQEDVNFVLDVNEFVSNTPNAKDVTVESPKRRLGCD